MAKAVASTKAARSAQIKLRRRNLVCNKTLWRLMFEVIHARYDSLWRRWPLTKQLYIWCGKWWWFTLFFGTTPAVIGKYCFYTGYFPSLRKRRESREGEKRSEYKSRREKKKTKTKKDRPKGRQKEGKKDRANPS